MKLADFLRGVEGVIVADVHKVFDTAKAFIAGAPLPSNIKTDLTNLVTDAGADFDGFVNLGNTLAGAAAADAVDDITTLFMNTKNAVSNSKDIKSLSAAEKTILYQTWTAMRAQGDTLLAQALAGLDPTKPSVQQPATNA